MVGIPSTSTTEAVTILQRLGTEYEITTTYSPELDTETMSTVTDAIELTTTNDETLLTTIEPEIITEFARKQLLRPKLVDNVLMVYPSEMSGIPKTTPKNMPESNEMRMFDDDMGVKLHLIFATNSTEATVTSAPITVSEVETTMSNFVHENEDLIIRKTSHSTTTEQTIEPKKKRRFRPYRKRVSTTPIDEIQLTTPLPLAVVKDKRNRLVNFYKKNRNEESISEEESSAQPDHVRTEKINRHRLFNASNRLNYLRKSHQLKTSSTTAESVLDDDEHSEVTTSQSIEENVRLPKPKPNQTLMRKIDTEHKFMIEQVRLVLMSASQENVQIVGPPKYVTSNRVKNIEKMLVGKLETAYKQMKHNYKPKRIQNSTENSGENKRPYRGRKRFQVTDLPVYPSATIATSTVAAPTTTSAIFNSPFIKGNLRRRRLRPTTTPTTSTPLSTDISSTVKPVFRYGRRRTPPQFRRNKTPTTTTTISTTPIPSTTSTSTTTTTTTTEEALPTTILENIENTESNDITTTELSATEITTLPSPPTDLLNLASKLIADFKPSPLWTFGNHNLFGKPIPDSIDDTIIDEISEISRDSRDTFRAPRQFDNGFVPMLRQPDTEPLLIIGPIPKPTINKDDARINYSLPIGTGQFFS